MVLPRPLANAVPHNVAQLDYSDDVPTRQTTRQSF